MTKIFSIFGYGVPKDITKDDNYRRYLSIVFNQIFDAVANGDVVILFCGGPTDCFKPYKRTEAGEMVKLFKSFAGRKEVKKQTKKWKYILRAQSVCGLENILYTVGYLKKNRIKKAEVVIFCEQTRSSRIRRLVNYGQKHDKLLRGIKFVVTPIDFDLSSNRYLDKKFILKREGHDFDMEFKAIQSREALLRWRKWHLEKLEYLRKNGYDKNGAKVVEKWWREHLC
jgi:hypothetical protein